jgi:hypothetical protein
MARSFGNTLLERNSLLFNHKTRKSPGAPRKGDGMVWLERGASLRPNWVLQIAERRSALQKTQNEKRLEPAV